MSTYKITDDRKTMDKKPSVVTIQIIIHTLNMTLPLLFSVRVRRGMPVKTVFGLMLRCTEKKNGVLNLRKSNKYVFFYIYLLKKTPFWIT